MTTVELSQHTIKLQPPQRLLMLEVTSEERGFCMRIFPAGGVAVYDLNLVSKTRGPGSTTGVDRRSNFDAFDSMAMMRRLSEAFSQIAEIDGRFPWSTTSPSVISRLRFALSRASATASPELVSMSGGQLKLQSSSRSVRQRSFVTFVGSARPLWPTPLQYCLYTFPKYGPIDPSLEPDDLW